MQTPWERARKKTKSQRQEERLGEFQGSRRQPGSGRIPGLSRDARMFDNFLVEARTTDARSYAVGVDEFQKITQEALRTPPGCLPAMQVTIQGVELWVMRLADQDAQQIEISTLRKEVSELREKLGERS